MMKNKVILHKQTSSVWLVEDYNENDNDIVFLVELKDPKDGWSCLHDLVSCTDDPLATVDLARDLGVADDDECCLYLRRWSDSALDKIEKIMYKDEVKSNGYLN